MNSMNSNNSMNSIIVPAIIAAFITGVFFGALAGIRFAEVENYAAGYDAAMNHVRTTIETKMPDLAPFYMADLGIRFIPRGNNIAGIKYIEERGERYASLEARPPAACPRLTGVRSERPVLPPLTSAEELR